MKIARITVCLVLTIVNIQIYGQTPKNIEIFEKKFAENQFKIANGLYTTSYFASLEKNSEQSGVLIEKILPTKLIVSSFAETEKSIFAATRNSGLIEINKETKKIFFYNTLNSALPSNQLISVLYTSQKQLWIASHDKLCKWYSRDSIFVIDFKSNFEGYYYLLNNLSEDSKGVLWFTNFSPVMSFDGVKINKTEYNNSFDEFYCLKSDQNGYVWGQGSNEFTNLNTKQSISIKPPDKEKNFITSNSKQICFYPYINGFDILWKENNQKYCFDDNFLTNSNDLKIKDSHIDHLIQFYSDLDFHINEISRPAKDFMTWNKYPIYINENDNSFYFSSFKGIFSMTKDGISYIPMNGNLKGTNSLNSLLSMQNGTLLHNIDSALIQSIVGERAQYNTSTGSLNDYFFRRDSLENTWEINKALELTYISKQSQLIKKIDIISELRKANSNFPIDSLTYDFRNSTLVYPYKNFVWIVGDWLVLRYDLKSNIWKYWNFENFPQLDHKSLNNMQSYIDNLGNLWCLAKYKGLYCIENDVITQKLTGKICNFSHIGGSKELFLIETESNYSIFNNLGKGNWGKLNDYQSFQFNGKKEDFPLPLFAPSFSIMYNGKILLYKNSTFYLLKVFDGAINNKKNIKP